MTNKKNKIYIIQNRNTTKKLLQIDRNEDLTKSLPNKNTKLKNIPRKENTKNKTPLYILKIQKIKKRD